MRSSFLLGLSFTALLACAASRAQVTLNPDALAHLQASQPQAAPSTAAKPAVPAPSPVRNIPPPQTVPRIASPPTVATVPPEIAKLPPPVVVATRPPSKPVPPKPVPNAQGQAAAIQSGGVELQFAPGGSDLNPAMDQALRDFARKSLPGPVSVDAFSAPDANDPSTPRRLSLERALAVRAILIDAGLASEKIYVRVHAPNPAQPADKLDITLAVNNR
jgi:outer membrane protein OmpA-like peptidoglycan-associated protein